MPSDAHSESDENPSLQPVNTEPSLPITEEVRPRLGRWRSTLAPLVSLLLTGSIVLLFAWVTVHRRPTEELRANVMAQRSHFSIAYWLDHGYFHSGGAVARVGSETTPVVFHRSSTSGRFLSGFLLEKAYSAITGRYSWRLLALHNQFISLLASTLLALLGYTIAIRWGASGKHALVLACCVQAVHFTFSDNLALYWGTTGREWFLALGSLFLLLEARAWEQQSRKLAVAQALTTFALTYVLSIESLFFLSAYGLVTLLIRSPHMTVRRRLAIYVVPPVLAFATIGLQLFYASVMFPDIPKIGSGFLFRTGLDGSSQYYVDHLDIAFNRDFVRSTSPDYPRNKAYLLQWTWLFAASVVSIVGTLLAAWRRRVPPFALVSLFSLTGTYVIYAAIFSQSVSIHPYLYDTLLFAPCMLALFVFTPMLGGENRDRSVVVLVMLLLAIWISMLQLRRYALRYPLPPPPPKTAGMLPGLPA